MKRNKQVFWEYLSWILPKTQFGDFVFSWLKFVRVHRRLPRTSHPLFNDELFRIKTTRESSNPLRVFITDKEFFKNYVKAVVGNKYVVPTIAVLRSKEEVEAFEFPEAFCAKPTHMSGKLMIVKGDAFEKNEIKGWFDLDHYLVSREPNYRHLEPKVIIEPIIFGQADITDFRIFCYRSKAKIICLDIGKYTEYRRAFYSLDWVKQDYSLGYPIYQENIPRPENLTEMINVAQKLADGLDFIRVDFYTDGKSFFLGEMTNCHASASQKFIPLSAEQVVSDIIFSEESNVGG